MFIFHFFPNQTGCCVCCTQCNRCGCCNEILPKEEQCTIYCLVKALDTILNLRNTFFHLKGNQLSRFLDHGERFEKFPDIPNWKALMDLFHEMYMDVVSFLSSYLFQTEQQRNEYKAKHHFKIQQIITNSTEEINKSYHQCIMKFLHKLDHELAATDEMKELKTTIDRLEAKLERHFSQDGGVMANNGAQYSPTGSEGNIFFYHTENEVNFSL